MLPNLFSLKTLKKATFVALLAGAISAAYWLLYWLPSLADSSFSQAAARDHFVFLVRTVWLPWLILLPFAEFLLGKISFLPLDGYKPAGRFLAALLVLGCVHGGLALAMLHTIAPPATPPTLSYGQALFRLLFQQGLLLLDALILIALAASRAVRGLQQRIADQEQDSFRLSRHLTDSRLQTLKMQLNPHFLFNTLNGLSVLIDKEETEKARDMLGELSNFLRQALRNPREKWISLEQELEFVRQYLRIEQYRFGSRLTCFEECEPLALTAKVPPMLLQPLFENAIVHGLAHKQGECRLGFECRLYDRYLNMLIFDNGDNFDASHDPLQKGGIGLGNVQARLQEIYGNNYTLQIEKKQDGTLVSLKLPAYKDSQF